MSYLLFHTDKNYDQGSLEDHLKYLQDWGGTPDFWTETNSILESVDEFRNSGYEKLTLVDGDTFEEIEVFEE